MRILIFGDNNIGNYLFKILNKSNDIILYNIDTDLTDLLDIDFNIIFCCYCINNFNRDYIYDLQEKLIHFVNKKIILLSSMFIYNQYILDQNEMNNFFSEEFNSVNCLMIEQWIINNFKDHHIIRLPFIFGTDIIEDNIIYKLLNGDYENINPYDVYSWYCIDDLLLDIKHIILRDIKIVNLISESISTFSIISSCFEFDIIKKFLEYDAVNTKKYRYTSKYIIPKSKLHVLNRMIDFFETSSIKK